MHNAVKMNRATKNGQKIIQVLSGRSNAFIVCNGNHFLLVHCGPKNKWTELRDKLNALGVRKGNLNALVLTHAHFDHAENAHNIQKEFGAQILIHSYEAQFFKQGFNSPIKGSLAFTKLLAGFFGKRAESKSYTSAHCVPFPGGSFDLKELGFCAIIMPTPGHTAGSVSVIVEDEIALAGDSMIGLWPKSVYPPYAVSLHDMVASWGK